MSEELIWVKKEFAERYKKIESDEERIKVFEDYLKTIEKESQREYKANLENLEEDVAIYTGLMLKVKQAFEKAKDEQLKASYELWENFEKEIPKIKEKINKMIQVVNPVLEKTNELRDMLQKINTWDIEKFVNCVLEISNLYGKNKEMFKFLINNFKEKK